MGSGSALGVDTWAPESDCAAEPSGWEGTTRPDSLMDSPDPLASARRPVKATTPMTAMAQIAEAILMRSDMCTPFITA